MRFIHSSAAAPAPRTKKFRSAGLVVAAAAAALTVGPDRVGGRGGAARSRLRRFDRHPERRPWHPGRDRQRLRRRCERDSELHPRRHRHGRVAARRQPHLRDRRAVRHHLRHARRLAATAPLKAGRNYTAVAAVDAAGSPQLALFTNNVSKTRKHTARLTVRHVAQAPAVNVWANGVRIVRGANFAWGKSATRSVPKGIYAAWVSLPRQYAPVIGPAVLALKAGTAYQVYAWGNATAGYNLAVIAVQVGTRR